MTFTPSTSLLNSAENDRYVEILKQRMCEIYQHTDSLFCWLLVFEYIVGIGISVWISPLSWDGRSSTPHSHIWHAIFLGALIISLPLYLAWKLPAQKITRNVIGISQMLSSAMIIHLSGGRIETHFHIFGSLAFLSFYRDWRVLIVASSIIAIDHMVRGAFWPQSVFGVITPNFWRAFEHIGWVAFEDLFLIWSCHWSTREMQYLAHQHVLLESTNERTEAVVTERTSDLAYQSRLSAFAADVGRTLVSEGDLKRALQYCVEATVSHIDAAFVQIATIDETNHRIQLEASAGLFTLIDGPHGWKFEAAFEIEAIAEQQIPFTSNDVIHDNRIGNRSWAIREGMTSFAGYPLIVENQVIGVMTLFARHVLSEITLTKLDSISNNIALGIERITKDGRLNEAMSTAEHASHAKSQFLANMSHELRTPMNAIIGYSEILVEDLEELGIQQCLPDLKKIRSAGKHLLGLINDILDVSKIEAGKMEVVAEEFEVGLLLEDVLTTLQPLIDEKKNRLIVEMTGDLGKTYSDQTKIRQILFNLLGNAAKFTDQGEIRLIARRTQQQGCEALELEVSDTGIGMTSEQLTKIGEPFVQAEGSTTRRFGGTGLGLTITKRFCKLLGGQLLIQSECHVGSRFTALIPVQYGAATMMKPSVQCESQLSAPIKKEFWKNELPEEISVPA